MEVDCPNCQLERNQQSTPILSPRRHDNHEYTEFSNDYHDDSNTIEGCFSCTGSQSPPPGNRTMTPKFKAEGRQVTIIQCCTTLRYASTNNADEERKEEFYRQLQSVMDKTLPQLVMATSTF
ncbi:unnamed protein product [Heterobilharzia americana]|nr:unnamed protein product [Heterobilharzia americana]